MTQDHNAATGRAAELRSAFDRSFAEPLRAAANDRVNLLGIHVGGDAYAVRLSEITGLFIAKKIVSVPSPAAEFLGLAGLRGSIVPVYCLGALLGYEKSSEPPRWLMLAGAGNMMALGFDVFDGHLRVARPAITRQAEGERARKYVHEFSHDQDLVRAIVSLPSVLDAIGQQAQQARPTKER